MGRDRSIDVRFYRLSEEIAPCFTALSCLTVATSDYRPVVDLAPPEWATMRFTQSGGAAVAGFGNAALLPCPPFSAGGPTSAALRYSMQSLRGWGLGILPLGWALYSDVPAADVTDRIADGMTLPAFARFRGLLDVVRNGSDDPDATAQRINRFLLDLRPAHTPARAQILACHAALRDPEIASVDQLAEATGVSRRTLERLTLRYFGYPPKLLLCRQRFLRSLASFMLAGHNNWSAAIDRHYFDQAHFVRDFRRFMGMTPSEYAEMPHPLLNRVMAQRMADQGAAPLLDNATVLPDLLEEARVATQPEI